LNAVFCGGLMKKGRKTYSVFQLASATVMMLALVWLTISLPFVNASQQEFAKQHHSVNLSDTFDGGEEEAGNPLGNTTEEKKPSGNSSLSEEYLHHPHPESLFLTTITSHYSSENATVYSAFHGEVHVPPPNVG
jgi:hypothetical protein